jgi:hypothetical protein
MVQLLLTTFQNDGEWSGVTPVQDNCGAMDVHPMVQTGGIEFQVNKVRMAGNFSILVCLMMIGWN